MEETKKSQAVNCKEKGCTKSDCSGCSHKRKIEKLAPREGTKVKHVIAIVSGKGGVGKSSVTAMMAVQLQKKGYKVGILDADITGPSIPKMFGATQRADGNKQTGIQPIVTKTGIRLMSINLLLESEDTPVVWRGAVIAGAVKQFWTDVAWGELDYLLIDMPPGTGDVPLTVFQFMPVEGIVMITTPQSLVSMIVKKACHMAEKMNIPIIGVIENYSYMTCGKCGEKMSVFGKSRLPQFAEENHLRILGELPIDPNFAEIADEGKLEDYYNVALEDAVTAIEEHQK